MVQFLQAVASLVILHKSTFGEYPFRWIGATVYAPPRVADSLQRFLGAEGVKKEVPPDQITTTTDSVVS